MSNSRTVATTADIDEHTLLLVNGYVRGIMDSEQLEIPQELATLFALFYWHGEWFISHGKSYRIEPDRATIIKLTMSRESAFGGVVIDSMSRLIHCWEFEIIDRDSTMSFGITTDDDRSTAYLHTFGAMDGLWGSWIDNYGHVHQGTVVKMRLDLNVGKLVLFRNGICVRPTYRIKCAPDIRYRMTVTFLTASCCARLVG